ncbi:hypothetical protein HF888_07325 [Bermanella marisrubri]|uniref:Uncharacterized protein n=1 Tax=Bermanella marisrubri TaxID=207949 RepID=Q1N4Z0_9GAMM|nr:hypothetical protein [Bermanella marisrubri]EAT13288.1 hypothetical protein RED65_00970 [Oceanobacter sp. RED65] [Bermanella marisrubri]QIZ84051.1 hypothetical protein HF888_07325 [Bermanella marisrubri]
MSRKKKARSIKRIAGIKTGTKERTKLENKQRKERKKAASKAKPTRQRSIFQQFLDKTQTVDPEFSGQPQKPRAEEEAVAVEQPVATEHDRQADEPKEQSLWDQLERPKNTDTF